MLAIILGQHIIVHLLFLYPLLFLSFGSVESGSITDGMVLTVLVVLNAILFWYFAVVIVGEFGSVFDVSIVLGTLTYFW